MDATTAVKQMKEAKYEYSNPDGPPLLSPSAMIPSSDSHELIKMRERPNIEENPKFRWPIAVSLIVGTLSHRALYIEYLLLPHPSHCSPISDCSFLSVQRIEINMHTHTRAVPSPRV